MFLAYFISSLQKEARMKERFRNSSVPASAASVLLWEAARTEN